MATRIVQAARGALRISGRALAVAALVASGLTASAVAQEGHPVKGSWLGEWKGNATHGDNVLMVLDWDGKDIKGVINPGTDNIQITKATLDPAQWLLTIEATGKNRTGADVNYVVEAKFENLELTNRSLVGTWRNQTGRGEFTATRQ
jgi:hypothetical protein